MREIVYDYATVPTIQRFSRSDKFIRGLMGPFGSGKSSGCVVELGRRSQAQNVGPDGFRRTRWAVIRNTYRQLEDTTWRTFKDWFPVQQGFDWLKTDHQYILKRGNLEAEFLFRALDRPEHVANLLSLDLTGAWVNEAREIPLSIINAIQGRVGRFPAQKDGGASWYGVIMDTNPPDDDSWWYGLFEEDKPDNAEVFKQPSGLSAEAENLGNLPPGYYENLAKGKDDEFIKVYINGLYGFVLDGKPVYPEYNDSIHCKECEPIKGKPIRRGWDFGWNAACTFSQMQPTGQWIVFDELVSDDIGVDVFADQVIRHTNEHWGGYELVDVGDPAGEQRSTVAKQSDENTAFKILAAKGINIRPGLQTLSMRLESVRKPLTRMIAGQPAFRLHPRCRMLRKGFMGGYQYRRVQTATEKYTDIPDKNQYSHPHDALQYDATLLFGSGLTSKPRPKKKIDYKQRLAFVR